DGVDDETVVVDGGNGGDGAVDEPAVSVAVAGVRQDPITGLIVPVGGPPRSVEDGSRQYAGVGEAAAGPVSEILGLAVGDDERHGRLGTMLDDVSDDSIGHRV